MRRLKRGQGKYKGKLPFKCFKSGIIGHFSPKFHMKIGQAKARKNHNIEKVETSINKTQMQIRRNSINKRKAYTSKKLVLKMKKGVTVQGRYYSWL